MSSTVFFVEQFWCPVTVVGRVACVTPSGELDILTTATLDRALHQAQTEADLVVLDLAEINFIDSAGARVLASAARRIRWSGGRLLLDAGAARGGRMLRGGAAASASPPPAAGDDQRRDRGGRLQSPRDDLDPRR